MVSMRVLRCVPVLILAFAPCVVGADKASAQGAVDGTKLVPSALKKALPGGKPAPAGTGAVQTAPANAPTTLVDPSPKPVGAEPLPESGATVVSEPTPDFVWNVPVEFTQIHENIIQIDVICRLMGPGGPSGTTSYGGASKSLTMNGGSYVGTLRFEKRLEDRSKVPLISHVRCYFGLWSSVTPYDTSKIPPTPPWVNNHFVSVGRKNPDGPEEPQPIWFRSKPSPPIKGEAIGYF